MLYSFIKAILKIIVKIFYPTKIYGRDNMINTGSVYICNHYSAWDIPVVGVSIPYKVIFLGKKELFKNRVTGYLYSRMGAIPVDRRNVSPSTIKTVIKKLKEGKKVLLFPEGTRNKTGTSAMAAIKNGAALFALSAKVPIIPMMLKSKPAVFKKNILYIGKPIYFDNFDSISKESIASASALIKQKMEELRLNITAL